MSGQLRAARAAVKVRAALLLLTLPLAACIAPSVSPAPGVQVSLAGPGVVAVAMQSGVLIEAQAGPRGTAAPGGTTPVKVTIRNDSGPALKVAEDQFRLVAAKGARLAPVPTAQLAPELQRQALPLGVLQPGAQASGFLYFPKPGKRAEGATLLAALVDAGSGQPLGEAELTLVLP